MTYIIIFLVKLLEVSIGTLRSVLTNKGMKGPAVLLAGLEITLWLAVTASVLTGLSQDVFKGVAYGLAYVLGIYAGIMLEGKLALGLTRIQIFATTEVNHMISQMLREFGYGVTSMSIHGKDGKKRLLLVDVKRKDVQRTLKLLDDVPDLYITTEDLRGVQRGEILRRMVK